MIHCEKICTTRTEPVQVLIPGADQQDNQTLKTKLHEPPWLVYEQSRMSAANPAQCWNGLKAPQGIREGPGVKHSVKNEHSQSSATPETSKSFLRRPKRIC